MMLKYLSRVYTLQKMRLRSSNSRYEHPLFDSLGGHFRCNPSAVTICMVVPNEYQHSLARDDESRYRHWPSRACIVSNRGGPDSREDIYFEAAYQHSLCILSRNYHCGLINDGLTFRIAPLATHLVSAPRTKYSRQIS
jgi:hypothetical protein